MVATLPLYGLILKWSLSVVCIDKVLHWASRVRVITCAYGAGNNSKRVTRGSQFTTMNQEKENLGMKGSVSGKPQCHKGRKKTKATGDAAAKV